MKRIVRFLILALILLASCEPVWAALSVAVGSASNVTSTTAILPISITGTNGLTNAVAVTVYYDRADWGTNAGSWSFSVAFAGTHTNGSALATSVAGLTPAALYFCRAEATESNTLAWSSPINFFTQAGAPTSTVTRVDAIPVMANTNGTLISPLGFLTANGIGTGGGLTTNDAHNLIGSNNAVNAFLTPSATNNVMVYDRPRRTFSLSRSNATDGVYISLHFPNTAGGSTNAEWHYGLDEVNGKNTLVLASYSYDGTNFVDYWQMSRNGYGMINVGGEPANAGIASMTIGDAFGQHPKAILCLQGTTNKPTLWFMPQAEATNQSRVLFSNAGNTTNFVEYGIDYSRTNGTDFYMYDWVGAGTDHLVYRYDRGVWNWEGTIFTNAGTISIGSGANAHPVITNADLMSGGFATNNFLVASGTNGSISGVVTGLNSVATFGATGRLTGQTPFTTNLSSGGSVTLTNTGAAAGMVNGSGATWGIGTNQSGLVIGSGGETQAQVVAIVETTDANGFFTNYCDLGGAFTNIARPLMTPVMVKSWRNDQPTDILIANVWDVHSNQLIGVCSTTYGSGEGNNATFTNIVQWVPRDGVIGGGGIPANGFTVGAVTVATNGIVISYPVGADSCSANNNFASEPLILRYQHWNSDDSYCLTNEVPIYATDDGNGGDGGTMLVLGAGTILDGFGSQLATMAVVPSQINIGNDTNAAGLATANSPFGVSIGTGKVARATLADTATIANSASFANSATFAYSANFASNANIVVANTTNANSATFAYSANFATNANMARLANVATLSFLGQRAGQAVTAQSLAQPATNQFSVVFSGSQSNYVDFTGPYARATNLVSGLGNSFTIECIFRNTDLVPGDYYNADGEGGFTGHAYRYLCLTAAQPTCPTTVTNTISIYSEYGALNGYSCLHGYIATNDSDPNLRILGEVANNPRLLTNEWHHGALTYTNSILTLFEDGNLIDSTVYPFNFLGANFTVLVGAGLPEAANSGCRPVEHLNGSVAEVRISNIARYTAPYLISDACFDVDANTLQYWKMNEGSSNVCYDSSGHSNNLILRYSNNSNNGGVWTNPAWATDTHVCGNPKSAVLNQPLVFNSNTVFKASDGHYVERIITNILGTYSDTFKDLGTISP